MPSRKYILVEGVPGHLVSDPHSPATHGSHARYAGWDHTPLPWIDEKTPPDVDHLEEHYTPTRQVVLDHSDLQAARKRGHLKIHDFVIAKTHDGARALFVQKKLLPDPTLASVTSSSGPEAAAPVTAVSGATPPAQPVAAQPSGPPGVAGSAPSATSSTPTPEADAR